jgi:hypothetical protein
MMIRSWTVTRLIIVSLYSFEKYYNDLPNEFEAIDSNPTSLSRAQKAAMTRKRNQVAQMVADITEKTPGKSGTCAGSYKSTHLSS